jgi:hypothetical protein
MSTLASPHPLNSTDSVGSRLTLGPLRAVRAWANQPASHKAMPIAGYMYGLALRPVDRDRFPYT